MKYKAWANDKTWLPEGSGLQMLNGVQDGDPFFGKAGIPQTVGNEAT